MVALVQEQAAFLQDVTNLLDRVFSEPGWQVTLGEGYRTAEQQAIYLQQGKTQVKQSLHMQRLAIDLNFFHDGKWVQSKVGLQWIGDYWESLYRLNRWGGNWTNFIDTPHFERRLA